MYAQDKGTLDPHYAASDTDRAVSDMIFNALVRYKPGCAPEIEPDLAEDVPEPEMVNGKQVWTFRLRRGVLFHPGPRTEAYELTSEDVIYSLQKAADPIRSAYSGEYTGMTFERVDAHTLRIILEKPLSSVIFLPKIADYSGGFIVSKRALEAMGDEAFAAHPVGTGPFRFEDYLPKDRVRLAANDGYFRGSPLLDGVDVLFLPDIARREHGLRSGGLHLIYGLREGRWIKKMRKEGMTVDVFGVGDIATVYFNMSNPFLKDLRVRRAIAYALDRDAFLAAFDGEGVGTKVTSPVPARYLPGGLSDSEVRELGLDFECNPERAAKLMAEAGCPQGFSLEVYSSEASMYREPYKIIRKQLSRINIDLRIHVVAHATMHEMIRRDLNPMVVYVAWRPNADVYLTRFFHSDSIVLTGKRPDTNFSHYDRIDRLIEEARLEPNPYKQIRIWKHAQIKILSDMAAFPLFYRNQVYARRPEVDYGHDLMNSMSYYPQVTERTKIRQ
ncbi:MAG: polyamine ABC transporter substrate-binding protein [Deltaproteobacteria bacterium]|nr:polyamine ABC transporter substrate-binding protein [Deltaproteobacteria bacterium]